MEDLESLINEYPQLIYHIILIVGLCETCDRLNCDSLSELADQFNLSSESLYPMIKKIMIHREFFEETLPSPLCKRYKDLANLIQKEESRFKVIADFSTAIKAMSTDQALDILYDFQSRLPSK